MTETEWLGESNELGLNIWRNKYRNNEESFDDWLNRVSSGNEDIKELILNKKFLFGGRILANRGLQHEGRKVTFSNCYVVTPPEDNLESIYDTAFKLAKTYSYGGGCGVDISKLSPAGAKINNAAKETSGAVSFMNTYSQVTEQIGQNGRRGALMISIDCHHPDLIDFINIKKDLTKVTKANISVRLTDDFMVAVRDNKKFKLEFKREQSGEVIKKVVNAREVFKTLAENNWDMAEPGCLFWDRIKNYNLMQNTDGFEYAGTNPCAEEPLPAGGSCLLGSMNLSEFVNEDKTFNYDELTRCVRIAVRGLNEVLEEGIDLHPLYEQRQSVANWRQIGLGIMGLADMLIKMEVKYGSEDALTLCDRIGLIMADTAISESANIAKETKMFEMCNAKEIVHTDFFKSNIVSDTAADIMKYGLANSQLLTIAPTGSLANMIGVSNGIEPIFANSYTRKTESLHGEDVYYKVYTPIVDKYMKDMEIDKEEDLPEYFVTASTLNYKDRINMQSVWQTHIDASISSTVNVPNSFTKSEVFDLYMYAWEKGLKGVTIYRDGCSRSGILTTDGEEKDKEYKRGEIIPASDNLIGLKKKLVTGCGSLHCEAFFDEETGDLREVYLSKGSTGGCNNFMIGLSRMISACARAGVCVDDIVDQLMSTGSCPSYSARSATKKDTSKGSCCPMAVGYALRDLHKKFEKMKKAMQEEEETETNYTDKPTCPNCGEELTFEGGCNICKSCGWSKCD